MSKSRIFGNAICKAEKCVGVIIFMSILFAAFAQNVSASCTYEVSNQWNSGFVASITITNDTGEAVNNWEVSWQYSGDNRIISSWNVEISGNNPYTGKNTDWNGNIQSGQSISFGFQGTSSGTAETPVVTGSICGGGDTDTRFVGNITHSGSVPYDFANYWNQITCENEGKWGSVESSRDNMNWSGVDAAYNFARQNGMKFKHHTFIWGKQYPRWMDSLSQSEQREEVEEWIRLYCERYPDTELIDVVNEPDHASPPWKDALGGAGSSGHDWVIWSFEKARQYCPNATLILNDYNVLRWDTSNFVSIANKIKAQGLLDAVGAQAHGLENQSFSELQSNFNQVAGIGLPIYISEYDINLADDNQQRNVMAEQFPFFYEHSQVAGITLWGYIYGQTWLDNTGLIRFGQPRPAMIWLMNYLGR